MIRVTYEYVCDRCGNEIRKTEVGHYPSIPGIVLPQPAEVPMALGKHLCEPCAALVSKAIRPLELAPVANKVPA